MIEVDTQIRMIVANLNDKLASITNEFYTHDEAFAGYIDEKLKSIEWDIRVLRNRVDLALKSDDEKKREDTNGNN